jgi:hypothetical protein
MRRILFLVALLCGAQPAFAAWARVSDTTHHASFNTVNPTISYSPTTGNFIGIAITDRNSIDSVSDDGAAGGSTYACSINEGYSPAPSYIVGYCYTISAHASVTTITLHLNTGANTTGAYLLMEYSYTGTPSVDSTSTQHQQSASSTFTTNTAAPGASDLEVGVFFNFTNGTTTFTASAPFTIINNQGDAVGGVLLAAEDQLNAGTTTATMTTSGNVDASSWITTFKTGGASAGTFFLLLGV